MASSSTTSRKSRSVDRQTRGTKSVSSVKASGSSTLTRGRKVQNGSTGGDSAGGSADDEDPTPSPPYAPSITSTSTSVAPAFLAAGSHAHLVELLDRDMLQRDPAVPWHHVAGLQEAKSILQEALVLPVIMPDFFRVCIKKEKENILLLLLFFLFISSFLSL